MSMLNFKNEYEACKSLVFGQLFFIISLARASSGLPGSLFFVISSAIASQGLPSSFCNENISIKGNNEFPPSKVCIMRQHSYRTWYHYLSVHFLESWDNDWLDDIASLAVKQVNYPISFYPFFPEFEPLFESESALRRRRCCARATGPCRSVCRAGSEKALNPLSDFLQFLG